MMSRLHDIGGIMQDSHRLIVAALGVIILAGCAQRPTRGYPYFKENLGIVRHTSPAVIC